MTVYLKNFLNPKIKMSKMGEYQELLPIAFELNVIELIYHFIILLAF